MTTRTLLEPVYQTTCDACGEVIPPGAGGVYIDIRGRGSWPMLKTGERGSTSAISRDFCDPCARKILKVEPDHDPFRMNLGALAK